MKTYLTNLDFELLLEKEYFEKPEYNKINSTLEYLFFWYGEKAFLYSEKEYSDEYFQYIEGLTGVRPQTTRDDSELICWWGKLDSKEDFLHERAVNSNKSAHEARKELGFQAVPSYLLNSKEELASFISEQEKTFVVKNNFGFSGKGLNFQIEKVRSFPVIAEPWVHRIRDFGVYLNESDFFIIQNNMTKNGAYRASLIKTFNEAEALEAPCRKVFNFYQKKFQVKEIQIDTFQFLENSEIKYQYLCEVNHRRSMGQIAFHLSKKFSNAVSFMAMVPKGKMKSFPSFQELYDELSLMNYNPVTKRGVVILSSSQEEFQTFFLCEESERSLQHMIIEWWGKIGKSGEPLLPEFIVNL
ncbi:MAG: hypothetical protein NXH75_00125 [Halobacteriovoraceae bacterium]|nr:hypothetical protein [Halobacteriovoraceae bacterium]